MMIFIGVQCQHMDKKVQKCILQSVFLCSIEESKLYKSGKVNDDTISFLGELSL